MANTRELAEEIAALRPELVFFLAFEFVKLIRELAEQNYAAMAAYKARDVQLARRHCEELVQALQTSIERCVKGEARKALLGRDTYFFAAELIEDAIYSARMGHAHWLTARESELTIPPEDVRRAMVEGRAAAVLDLFGRSNGGSPIVADRIAKALKKAGFFTKRREAPKASTIREWLKDIRQGRHRSRRSRHHEIRELCFDGERKMLNVMGFAKALDLLEHDCRLFTRRMFGALPRNS